MTGQIPYVPAGPAGEPRPRPVMPEIPELDKRRALIESDAHKGVVAFLEWLDGEQRDERGYALVKFRQGEPEELGGTRYEQVLAHFYGLDLEKIAAEQEALLAYLRELNAQ